FQAEDGIRDFHVTGVQTCLPILLDGLAPETLIDTYTVERELAADENLLNSTRSTDFITPKSAASRSFRNAVLNLAREHPFARGRSEERRVGEARSSSAVGGVERG